MKDCCDRHRRLFKQKNNPFILTMGQTECAKAFPLDHHSVRNDYLKSTVLRGAALLSFFEVKAERSLLIK